MNRASHTIAVVLLVGLASAADPMVSQDELTLVAKAMAREREAFDDIKVRYKANKLKPEEKKQLFGKEAAKKAQEEMLRALEEKIATGKASCRMLSPVSKDLRIGDCGALDASEIVCDHVRSDVEFFGHWVFYPRTKLPRDPRISLIPENSQRLLFRGITGDFIDGRQVKVPDGPLIVIDRITYTVASGGAMTTYVVEPLAVVLVRHAKSLELK